MKRKIAFLVGLIGLVVVIIGVVRALGGRSPKEGVLKVTSNQAASIFLDNKHAGRTPFEDKVAAGEYTLKIVPESTIQSFATWQGKIAVSSKLLTFVNRDLSSSELSSAGEVLWLEKITSKQSELSVTTIPDGATVILDDATRGVTPLTLADVTPGEHGLTVTSAGFATRSLKLKTTAGYKLNASIQLALSQTVQPVATESPTPIITEKPTPTKGATSSGTLKDPAKPFVTIKDTPTGFLRVRMEPTTAATEAAQVKPGEKYTIVDSQKDSKGTTWYQIKYDGTNTGWISGQYAEKVE